MTALNQCNQFFFTTRHSQMVTRNQVFDWQNAFRIPGNPKTTVDCLERGEKPGFFTQMSGNESAFNGVNGPVPTSGGLAKPALANLGAGPDGP
jgi:hypothetical protein